jgi:hypothetical protein
LIKILLYELLIIILSIIAKSLRMSPPMQVFEVTWCTKNEAMTSRQTFAVRTKAERDLWMQNIIESATSAFPRHVTRQFNRAGWVHLKVK